MTTLETLPVQPADPLDATDSTATVRPARADDAPALDAMHERCSMDSRVGRWHAPIRTIPRRYLNDVTGARPDHLGFVLDMGRAHLAGLASAALIGPETWEIGVLVEDEFQRAGWGRRLLDELVTEMCARNATTLIAQTLAERRWVLRTVMQLGPTTVSSESGIATATVDLSGVAG